MKKYSFVIIILILIFLSLMASCKKEVTYSYIEFDPVKGFPVPDDFVISIRIDTSSFSNETILSDDLKKHTPFEGMDEEVKRTIYGIHCDWNNKEELSRIIDLDSAKDYVREIKEWGWEEIEAFSLIRPGNAFKKDDRYVVVLYTLKGFVMYEYEFVE